MDFMRQEQDNFEAMPPRPRSMTRGTVAVAASLASTITQILVQSYGVTRQRGAHLS